eukprot:XP_001697648.1 predicted protein [Chlamydomonas reinhardtii]
MRRYSGRALVAAAALALQAYVPGPCLAGSLFLLLFLAWGALAPPALCALTALAEAQDAYAAYRASRRAPGSIAGTGLARGGPNPAVRRIGYGRQALRAAAPGLTLLLLVWNAAVALAGPAWLYNSDGGGTAGGGTADGVVSDKGYGVSGALERWRRVAELLGLWGPDLGRAADCLPLLGALMLATAHAVAGNAIAVTVPAWLVAAGGWLGRVAAGFGPLLLAALTAGLALGDMELGGCLGLGYLGLAAALLAAPPLRGPYVAALRLSHRAERMEGRQSCSAVAATLPPHMRRTWEVAAAAVSGSSVAEEQGAQAVGPLLPWTMFIAVVACLMQLPPPGQQQPGGAASGRAPPPRSAGSSGAPAAVGAAGGTTAGGGSSTCRRGATRLFRPVELWAQPQWGVLDWARYWLVRHASDLLLVALVTGDLAARVALDFLSFGWAAVFYQLVVASAHSLADITDADRRLPLDYLAALMLLFGLMVAERAVLALGALQLRDGYPPLSAPGPGGGGGGRAASFFYRRPDMFHYTIFNVFYSPCGVGGVWGFLALVALLLVLWLPPLFFSSGAPTYQVPALQDVHLNISITQVRWMLVRSAPGASERGGPGCAAAAYVPLSPPARRELAELLSGRTNRTRLLTAANATHPDQPGGPGLFPLFMRLRGDSCSVRLGLQPQGPDASWFWRTREIVGLRCFQLHGKDPKTQAMKQQRCTNPAATAASVLLLLLLLAVGCASGSSSGMQQQPVILAAPAPTTTTTVFVPVPAVSRSVALSSGVGFGGGLGVSKSFALSTGFAAGGRRRLRQQQ